MNYDKPNISFETSPAIIRPVEKVDSKFSEGDTGEGECSFYPTLDLSCFNLGGNLARSPSGTANASTSPVTLSGNTNQIVGPSPSFAPGEPYYYIVPESGPIPGEAASQIAEADNKYNEQEISR